MTQSVDEGSGRHSGDECMTFVRGLMEGTLPIRETVDEGSSA